MSKSQFPRRILSGLLLGGGLLLSACGGGGTPDGKTTPVGNATPNAEESQMLEAVNAARAVARQCQGKDFKAAPPVTWNGLLGAAARAHAQDMAARDYLSHDSPEGGTQQARVEAAGYTGWQTLGENIAAGYSATQIFGVMASWLGSSTGHCETLMNPAFKEMGLGYAPSSGGTYGSYWVQDFAAR